MLRELEIAIARGQDVQQVRQRLIEKARAEHQQTLDEIERDTRTAELINYALRLEPKESPAYGVAKGIQRRLQRQYPEDDSIARALLKDAWLMERRKEQNDDTAEERKQSNTSGESN